MPGWWASVKDRVFGKSTNQYRLGKAVAKQEAEQAKAQHAIANAKAAKIRSEAKFKTAAAKAKVAHATAYACLPPEVCCLTACVCGAGILGGVYKCYYRPVREKEIQEEAETKRLHAQTRQLEIEKESETKALMTKEEMELYKQHPHLFQQKLRYDLTKHSIDTQADVYKHCVDRKVDSWFGAFRQQQPSIAFDVPSCPRIEDISTTSTGTSTQEMHQEQSSGSDTPPCFREATPRSQSPTPSVSCSGWSMPSAKAPMPPTTKAPVSPRATLAADY